MRKRFYRAPFHRRILPWVFIIIFFAMAPAVVFYTAGYRYNPKKGVIERNGTLIVDSIPKGASITLNGSVVPERSPVTLQNVAPGTYTIRVTSPGYSIWEKTLDVRPERVTFANHIHLWKTSGPVFLVPEHVRGIRASPSGRYLAALAGDATSSLLIFDLSNDTAEFLPFSSTVATSQRVELTWNDAETAVLVRELPGSAYLAERKGSVQKLPDGFYRWDGGTLIGALEGEMLMYSVSNGDIRRTPLPNDVIDEQNGFRLFRRNGGTVLGEVRTPDRVFELPSGNWHFAGRISGYPFVTDGTRWLGIDVEENTREGLSFFSDDAPDILQKSGETFVITRTGGELWLTIIGRSSELLVRKSQAITGAVWHRLGEQNFYSTQAAVQALDIDSRNGRYETRLASFDEIDGMTKARNVLYIAGVRDGQRGIYRLDVE